MLLQFTLHYPELLIWPLSITKKEGRKCKPTFFWNVGKWETKLFHKHHYQNMSDPSPAFVLSIILSIIVFRMC